MSRDLKKAHGRIGQALLQTVFHAVAKTMPVVTAVAFSSTYTTKTWAFESPPEES
jgi:hypothetical protein